MRHSVSKANGSSKPQRSGASGPRAAAARFVKKHRLLLTLIPVLIMLCVIFFFSSQDAEQSGQESDRIVSILVPAVIPDADSMPTDTYIAMQNEVKHLVRKAAHLAEFSLLGFFLAFFSDALFEKIRAESGSRTRSRVLFSFLTGAITAAADEGHQFFSAGRTPQLTDVLIDSAGVLLGILAAGFCLFLYSGRRKKRS